MDRREFLKTVLAGACGVALGWRLTGAASAAEQTEEQTNPKPAPTGPTVAIKRFGAETEGAAAVAAALAMLGGLDRIVKKGDRVVIKPNMCSALHGRWLGRVTGNRVMEGVIKAVADCGATPIVAEGTCEHGFGTTTGFAERIGLLAVCRRYGAEFVDLNNDEVVAAKVPRPLLWSELHVARRVLDCDRFISVPVMKLHRAVGITLGMKNLVGVTSPRYYGRGSYVRDALHDMEKSLWAQRYGRDMFMDDEIMFWLPLSATIADLVSIRPIDLVVVDGTFGEERNSPGGDMVDIKERSGSYLVLAGADPVATDTVGAHIMRQAPGRLQQLRFASAKGLGSDNLADIRVVGERLEDVAVPMRAYIMQ